MKDDTKNNIDISYDIHQMYADALALGQHVFSGGSLINKPEKTREYYRLLDQIINLDGKDNR